MNKKHKEYQRLMKARQSIISTNASRRIKGLTPLPVPDKPKAPLVSILYDKDGTYVGRCEDEEEAKRIAININGTVKMEPMRW